MRPREAARHVFFVLVVKISSFRLQELLNVCNNLPQCRICPGKNQMYYFLVLLTLYIITQKLINKNDFNGVVWFDRWALHVYSFFHKLKVKMLRVL